MVFIPQEMMSPAVLLQDLNGGPRIAQIRGAVFLFLPRCLPAPIPPHLVARTGLRVFAYVEAWQFLLLYRFNRRRLGPEDWEEFILELKAIV